MLMLPSQPVDTLAPVLMWPVLLTLLHIVTRSQIYLHQTVRPSLAQPAGRKTNPTFRVFTSASHSELVMSLQELIGSA